MAGRNDIRDRVADGLGFRTDLLDKIVKMMAYVQETILEQGQILPWFLQKVDHDLTLADGANIIDLPDDFLVLDEDYGIWHYDSSDSENPYKARLQPRTLAYLNDKWGGETGSPKDYYIGKDVLYIGPPADAEKTIRLGYYAKETNFRTGDLDNAWSKYAADVVEYETLLRLARQLRDDALVASAKEQLNQAYTRFNAEVAEREIVDQIQAMGGED